jgi:hypothetical protein
VPLLIHDALVATEDLAIKTGQRALITRPPCSGKSPVAKERGRFEVGLAKLRPMTYKTAVNLRDFTLETGMSGPQSRYSKVSVPRRAWEPPALAELKIGTETKSNRGRASRSAEPPQPAAAATKLGFSLEWAFPLSRRFEK